MDLRSRLIGLFILSLFAASGCGRPGGETAPVEGVVRLDGQPLDRGEVRFTPKAGRAASGRIQNDGTFQLSTYSTGDGARIGVHRVSISAFEGEPGATDYEVDSTQSKSKIPIFYATPESSGLTFDVKSGQDNHAEFDLTTQ